MAKWYVKELSKLTHVTVQTLHHYDRIDLLKPSLRLDNGYRVYSETDLLRLQQIIALKFFGFELAQIKELLTSEINMQEHFSAQSRLLEQKAQALLDASHRLKHITAESHLTKSIPWEKIIETIEVYRMTQEIENSWAGKVLSADELKQYVKFAKGLESRFTVDQKAQCTATWSDLVKEVNNNLQLDPASEKGKQIAKQVMEWVNNLYGDEFIELRMAIWQKAFKGGHGTCEHGLNAKAVEWLDQAMHAYYRHRILRVLDQAGRMADAEVISAWRELMTDMYANCEEPKQAALDKALKDEGVSAHAKKLLQQVVKTAR